MIPYLATVTALVHVAFRLSYLFYVGSALRKQQEKNAEGREGTFEEWLRFKSRAAFILTADLLTFILTVLLTARSFSPPLPYPLIGAIGVFLVFLGAGFKYWAYRVVGYRVYYWYHSFCPDHEKNFSAKGPYRYFKNPMYGVGYMHLFGLALIFLSFWGLFAALFDWTVVWIFYWTCERPHTRRHLRKLDFSAPARPNEAFSLVPQGIIKFSREAFQAEQTSNKSRSTQTTTNVEKQLF